MNEGTAYKKLLNTLIKYIPFRNTSIEYQFFSLTYSHFNEIKNSNFKNVWLEI